MEHKNYTINGKTYWQAPMVLGQVKQFEKVTMGLDLSAILDDLNAGKITALFEMVGGRLPEILAVMLTPEGVRPMDKDVEAVAREFEDCPAEEMFATAVEAYRDFFTFNRASSLMEGMLELIRAMNGPKPARETQDSGSS